ncbi:cobalamin B12-binding domain-containing protein, partial [bacterium]|nr:cobalamin B12-binding domain-containing protein [bacterium]
MGHIKRILLIDPPWHRNTEPSLGLGLIQADLKNVLFKNNTSFQSEILDLNAEIAWEFALKSKEDGTTQTHRAILNRKTILQNLTSPSGYSGQDNYVKNINGFASLLRSVCRNTPWKITPGNYNDPRYKGFGANDITRIISDKSEPQLVDLLLNTLAKKVDDLKPDITGLSINYRTQFVSGLLLAEHLSEMRPKMKIYIGGAFVSCLSKNAKSQISNLGFTPVEGPGELFFHENLYQKKYTELPFLIPDFTGIDFSKYFSPVKTLPLISSRGCYWAKCSFCDECRESFRVDKKNDFLARFTQLANSDQQVLLHLTDHAIPPIILSVLTESHISVPWYGFVRATPDLAR